MPSSAARPRFEGPARPEWWRHSPGKTTASVAAVVALIAHGAEWRVLSWEPIFIREAVHSKALIADASRTAPAVDAWPKQYLFLPFPANRQDFHWNCTTPLPSCSGWGRAGSLLCARALGCRGSQRPVHSCLCHVSPNRGRRFRGRFVVAARVRGKRIVSFKPIDTVVAEGCVVAMALRRRRWPAHRPNEPRSGSKVPVVRERCAEAKPRMRTILIWPPGGPTLRRRRELTRSSE